MTILKRGALQKLKIKAFTHSSRKRGEVKPAFEAMYNPGEISQSYGIQYGKKIALNSSGQSVNYIYSLPANLDLTLLLDGTGVHQVGGLPQLSGSSVADRVDHFLTLAYHTNGDIHEPHYLSVEWGSLTFWGSKQFNCRLRNVQVTYTSFDQAGNALRAELKVKLLSDEEVGKRKKKSRLSSPDLTHRRVVKAGDTLPLLCREIYGQATHYLMIAGHNQLDHFRSLEPGQVLYFPPLEKRQ